MSSNILDRISAVCHGLSRFSVPILYDDHRGRTTLLGTGFIIFTVNRFYLISASHVLQNVMGGKIDHYIPLKDKMKLKIGGWYKISIESQIGVDVGCYELILPQEFDHNEFHPYQCLSSSNLELEFDCVDCPMYFISGYPSNKTKVDFSKKIINSKAFSLAGVANNITISDKHIKIILDPDDLNYNGEKVSKLPELKGISGSPVWIVGGEMSEMKVCGVVTDYIRKNNVIRIDKLNFLVLDSL